MHTQSLLSLVPTDSIIANVSKSGTARAGMRYSITCTVSKRNDGLMNYPTATWTFEGAIVISGNGITVSYTSPNTSTLIFDPLRTSHAGSYYCVGNLASSALDSPLTVSTLVGNTVQSKSFNIQSS